MIGLLSKLNMIGLAPGILFGLVALVIKADAARRHQAIRGALAALGVIALPVGTYMLLNSTVWDRNLWFGTSGVPPITIKVPGVHHPEVLHRFLEFGSYMWQFNLPRPPFMHKVYFETYPLREIWFNGFIGQFGWL